MDDDRHGPRARASVAASGAVARARPRRSYDHRHSPPLGGDLAHAASRRRTRRPNFRRSAPACRRARREAGVRRMTNGGAHMTRPVACLAGDGVGPELMAAATRALDRVAELHSLRARRHAPAVRGRGRHAVRASAAARDARRVPQRRRDPRRVARTSRRSTVSRPTCQLAWRVARVHVGPARRSRRRPARSETGPTRLRVARAFACAAVTPRPASSASARRIDWQAGGRERSARAGDGLDVEEASLA